MIVRSLVLVAMASSCARAPASVTTQSVAPEVKSATATAPVAASAAVAGSATPGRADSAAPAEAKDKNPGAPAVKVAASTEPPPDAIDFTAQARTLFRVGACGPLSPAPSAAGENGGEGAPSGVPEAGARAADDPAARHCEELRRAYRDYQRSWVEVAKPFVAQLRPNDLPTTVVYPFGGGDLASALATFPDATEITTVSLEPAGDVRPIDTLTGDRLAADLAEHRSHLERLFAKAHSRTDNLEKEAKAELPGELLFELAALAAYGDEPVGLYYFHLRPDGTIAYLTKADLDSAKTSAVRRALFDDAELRFRAAGEPDGPVHVLRHISFNLDDDHLRAEPGLLAHLSAKGKVAAMTKAASHLLWNDHFSLMRNWLLDHTDWMISDSTGIPPRYAAPAGFVQDTYGTFDGPAPYGLPDARDAADFKKLFASQPAHEMSFRFGYPDRDGHGHMVITRRGGPLPSVQ